ncbi:hypothetical protein FB567DRAFT_445249 [Paraphoma chrysanthemicola]|uniref:Heterokaryon incompatibility domain-containing protein n=1 Tax=Paraphoma chrysanthemicola TaxID=798071 RepID=A0A8K0R3S3_9PLEO|nr:hypothetical protein FB567DRAFT_445249 [Paraphoma chrysanthemicola]
MFAQEKEIPKLWIDKECIYQRKEDGVRYPDDHAHGVQIMDVVYGESTLSLGILSTPLTSRDEVDTLAALLERKIFTSWNGTDVPKLKSFVRIRDVQWVLLHILSDPRWSRGWIFQEDHLASNGMTLLIPYGNSNQARLPNHFGTTPGQLQVKLAIFKQAATMFCLANSESEESWPNCEILSKLKQYNIWNKRVYKTDANQGNFDLVRPWRGENHRSYGCAETFIMRNEYTNIYVYPTMTTSVLDDICSRSLEKEQDRIEIFANAMRFSTRLNTTGGSPIMRTGEYSLSVALLALTLINGEILNTGEFASSSTADNVMKHTLQSYLERYVFYYNVPSSKYQQSFISKCCLKSPKITVRGIETMGYLFRLLPTHKPAGKRSWSNPVRLSNTDRAKLRMLSRNSCSRKVPEGQKLHLLAQKAIEIVIEKLDNIWRDNGLAWHLRRHLELDRNPPPPDCRAKSTPMVLDMMSAIYQALEDDREIRLARFADDDDSTDPVGIFIAPEPNNWMVHNRGSNLVGGGAHCPTVFYSWNNPGSDHGRESLASLEVAPLDAQGRPIGGDAYHEGCFLRSYAWVNGVCDYRGREMEKYVFPLPGITEAAQARSAGESSRKRKRRQYEDA